MRSNPIWVSIHRGIVTFFLFAAATSFLAISFCFSRYFDSCPEAIREPPSTPRSNMACPMKPPKPPVLAALAAQERILPVISEAKDGLYCRSASLLMWSCKEDVLARWGR